MAAVIYMKERIVLELIPGNGSGSMVLSRLRVKTAFRRIKGCFY